MIGNVTQVTNSCPWLNNQTFTEAFTYDTSGQLIGVNFNLHTAMFYPNAYINFNSNGYYTKHYYNGMERIASRLGEQNLSINVNDPELQDRKEWQDSLIRKNVVEITGYEFLPVGYEQDPDDPKPIYDLPQIGLNNLVPNTSSIYYYHSNHLGSTCYVTDENASVVQGFLYAPFGEITNEYNSTFGNNLLPKYSFNAKELDEETGMYYYEARYMAPPVFISRDPLFEKYPTFTPYAYCANNPVKFIDPDGRDWYEAVNSETKQKEIKWTDYHSQKEMDDNGVCGKYLGLTYMDKNSSTYYSLYSKAVSYDKNKPNSIETVYKLAITDNFIINAVNSYKGSRSFWDKHNDMIDMCSSFSSAMANLTKNTPLKNIISPISFYSLVNSVLDYAKVLKDGTWDMSNTISAASNIISITGGMFKGKGGFYGAVISFYLTGINFASKKGAEVESSLRNYFSPSSSNNYFKNSFCY